MSIQCIKFRLTRPCCLRFERREKQGRGGGGTPSKEGLLSVIWLRAPGKQSEAQTIDTRKTVRKQEELIAHLMVFGTGISFLSAWPTDCVSLAGMVRTGM